MWQLYLGVLLFAGLHLFSTLVPKLRDKVKAALGEQRYKLGYSALSLLGIILLGLGYLAERNAGVTLLYEPLYGLRHFAMLLILVGFILIFSNGSLGHVRKTVRHPFSIGIALWSLAHLSMNGERAVVVIFGMFLIIALADIVFSFMRGQSKAFLPNWKHDLRGVAVGVVLFMVFAFGFHPYVLGIPVMR